METSNPSPTDTDLVLGNIHVTHRLSQDRAGTYCKAACACLARYHTPPTDLSVRNRRAQRQYRLHWELPDDVVGDENANVNDSACEGAYAVGFVCVERELDLVVVARAEHLSRGDWLVAPRGVKPRPGGWPGRFEDLNVHLLEVSGTGDDAEESRLKEKIQQVSSTNTGFPWIALVVGFRRARVLIEREGAEVD